METAKGAVPGCTLKCLRNVEDVSHRVHPVKYGVNTIGRGLNNDIVIKNLNVSRHHCQLRVEKNGSKDVAYIKDLGTSNGTIVGNINLIEHTEHQLNDLDMIVLASGDEGVVLQFLCKIECITSFSNLSNDLMNNKRKVSVDNSDEPNAVKIPKLVVNESGMLKLYPNEIKNVSNKLPNDLQQSELNQSTSPNTCKSITDSISSRIPIKECRNNSFNNTKPSCSHLNVNTTSVQVKTEPNANYELYPITNPSNVSKNIFNNIQQSDLNQPTSSGIIGTSVTNSISSRMPVTDIQVDSFNDIRPSCSYHKDNITSIQIKTEPIANYESYSNKNISLSTVFNGLQQSDLNQPASFSIMTESVMNSDSSKIPVKKLKTNSFNNIKPSCSHYEDIMASSLIKTEPNNTNFVLSQGIYREEEDSVIVIYSSDEENNIVNENDLKKSNIKNKSFNELNLNSIPKENACSSTSRIELDQNVPGCSIQYEEIEISDEDDVIFVPPLPDLNANKHTNTLLNPSDNNSDYISKCPKIIEPLPMVSGKKKDSTKILCKNKNVILTRAKSERKINNKKKAEEAAVDQNKLIIQGRRKKLQELAKNKITSSDENKKSNKTKPSNDNSFDEPLVDKLNKRTRTSRFQQNNNLNCIPSTSKSNVAKVDEKDEIINSRKKSKTNCEKLIPQTNNQVFQHSSLNNCSRNNTNVLNLAYFETLSRICKWNAVWLQEQNTTDQPPPLIKIRNKMKLSFENSSEYTSIVKSLMLYEIWSKISDSYNMILSKNPNLENSIFEKSLNKNIPLHTFDVQSVNKEFSSSLRGSDCLHESLWSIKCSGSNKNILENFSGAKFSLMGCLCIVIVQSKHFETDVVRVKKPTKSKNIFFAFVHTAKKIGSNNNTQLYIELIVTKKTETIPSGTPIHLMDIFYLHSELRLFQALSNVTTSSLSDLLISPQIHNYTIDYSKVNLKHFNINSLVLNDSQKEAVKMALTICLSKDPNVGLIIGPPGTGKTNVICNIVLTLMTKVQTKSKNVKNTKPKLLICAPSNEAVDALVRRILEIKKDIKSDFQFNVVRVGNGPKYDPHSPINDVMLDNIVKQRLNNPKNEDDLLNTFHLHSNKRDVEKDVLQKADVIVTTLNSCYSNRMENAFMPSFNKKSNICQFTACIVDEAGQCIEPLNYVPILLGIEKLVLVGDDKQLQPVIKSRPAKENGLGVSLFKRLKTWYEHKSLSQKNIPITMLDTQYRMHDEICLFPSKMFYKGGIKTAPFVLSRKQLPIQPYIILEHEYHQDNSGEINVGEAFMIVKLVDVLMKSDCKSLNIAVLTPYHKQREHINSLLRNNKISLNVNTIDSFQGGECDILLISTVRTHGIGFLDDVCRLNVALTRARHSLIICGNFVSLKEERVWCDLLENAKNRKLFKRVSKNVINNPRNLLAVISQ